MSQLSNVPYTIYYKIYLFNIEIGSFISKYTSSCCFRLWKNSAILINIFVILSNNLLSQILESPLEIFAILFEKILLWSQAKQ